jgi:dolichol-phosphate mannosyltransferase
MRILAVIPTYNEALTVGPLVDGLMALALNLGVMFVDDNSPDGTADRVRELGKKFPGREVGVLVRPPGPRGLGLAYRDGFIEAIRRRPDAILQMDADGQHPVEVVPRLAAALSPTGGEKPADLVLASRYTEGGSTGGWKLSRRLISTIGGGGARMMLRLPYKDLTGGFKLWRADLLAAMDFSRVESKGFVFQIEMTLRAKRMGARVVEVPYTFGARTAGETKMSAAITREAAWRMLRWAVRPPKVKKYK